MRWTGALGTSDSGLSELALGVAGEAEGADLSVDAGLASGTATAASTSASVAASAGAATGTGAALDATVSTTADTSATAGHAAGTGSAASTTASVAASSGAASGTGAAADGAPSTATAAPAFQSDAFQNDAFQTEPFNGTSAAAGVATGTGAAHSPAIRIGVYAHAGLASGYGAATGSTTESYEIGVATGTGRAFGAMAITFVEPEADDGAYQPGSGPAPSPSVGLLYAGVNLINDTLLQACNYTGAANGFTGSTVVRIRDRGHNYGFRTGQPLQWTIDGSVEWDGYVTEVRRGYFMIDPHDPETRVRFFELHGVDRNVLFLKRFLYDKGDPTKVTLTAYPADTHDDVIVKAYMASHLDLSDDGLTTSMIEHVGTPSDDSRISGSASWSWQDLMQFLTRETGAVYYIDPDRRVVLTDVDEPNAPYAISDRPVGAGVVGCSDLEIDFDASKMVNDAMIWGAGQGSALPVFSRTQDATSIATHDRWQHGAQNLGVFRQTSVDRISNSYVYGSPQSKRGGKDDAVAARCTVFTPGFRVGHKVELTSEVFDFTDVIPIRVMRVDFPQGYPRYQLSLSHEIDQPWNTFEWWVPGIPPFDFDFSLPEINIPDIWWPPPPAFDPCAPSGVPGVTIGELMGLPGFGLVSDGIDDFERLISNSTDAFSQSSSGPFWMLWQFAFTTPGAEVDRYMVDGSAARLAWSSGEDAGPTEVETPFLIRPIALPFESEVRFWWDEFGILDELDTHANPVFHDTFIDVLCFGPSNVPQYDPLEEDVNDLDSPRINVQLRSDDDVTTLRILAMGKDTSNSGNSPSNGEILLERTFVTHSRDMSPAILRYRAANDLLEVKFWFEDEDEPSTWLDAVLFPAVTSSYSHLRLSTGRNSGFATRPSGYTYVDEIGVAEDPCGDLSEPDELADHHDGRVCENLFRVEVDGDGDTHLRATSQFEPKSTEVWADGKLLRRDTDYIESPFLGRIEVLNHVDLGGWSADDPTKPVYMCYYASVIEPLDPPEPI